MQRTRVRDEMVRKEAARVAGGANDRRGRERAGDAGREDTKRLWNVECEVAAGGGGKWRSARA